MISRVVHSKLGGFYQFFTSYFPTYFPSYFTTYFPSFIAQNSFGTNGVGVVSGFNGAVTQPYYLRYVKDSTQRIIYCNTIGSAFGPHGSYIEVTMATANSFIYVDFDIVGAVFSDRTYALTTIAVNIVSGVSTTYPALLTVTCNYNSSTITTHVAMSISRYNFAGVGSPFSTSGTWQIRIPPTFFEGPAYYN